MKTVFHNLFTILLLTFCLVSFSVQAKNYYSDPVAGNINNEGSVNKPLPGLSSIFAANKTFVAGDTLFLRNGDHGFTLIKGVNTGFVVITPDAGHQPVLSRLAFSAFSGPETKFWKLEKLIIQSESNGIDPKGAYHLVEFFPNSSNITLSSCIIRSAANTTGWTRDDWRKRCNRGILTRDRANANYIIEDNIINNTTFAITISSSNTVVRRNTIQYFTNDGSRLTGSDILFEKNKVLDLIKVMLVSENHDDLFQAFTAVPGVGPACKNDTIRGNLFVNTTDTNRPFVGVTQGIGCFNGPFENWIVENNIVMTDHYHGISFYDATNCKIVNNTVMDPYLVTPVDPFENNSSSTGPAWIYLDGASTNNIVKNNLANTMNFASGVNTTAASNYSIGSISSYANYFVNVSNIAVPGSFDLHLKPGSLPINRGDNVNAPLVDFDGVARPQGAKVDCGAYEFVQSTAIPELKNAENGLKTYPNPFQNELNIDINAAFPQNYRVDILNLSGQIVFTESKNADTKLILNNISALLNGVYILKLTDESGNFSQNRICKVN